MSKISKWTLLKWAIWRRPKLGVLLKVTTTCLWYVWHYSGIRWIWEHLNPPTENDIKKQKTKGRRSATAFPLWLIGTYIALFGIAFGRYESHLDRYEIRTGALIALLANDKIRPIACSHIGKIQNIKVPFKPDVFKPDKTLKSFWVNTLYNDGIQVIVEAVESCKASLERAHLNGAYLVKVDLSNANLENANLEGTDLSKSSLSKANLVKACLSNANLVEANLPYANMKGANLESVNLAMANLSNANLSYASIKYANLFHADLFHTDLSNTNLSYSNLSSIYHWQHENWKGTNIFGITGAPDGFREWALAHGAVEEMPNEWLERVGGFDL